MIDKIVYINLDECKDRRKNMERQFQKFHITNYERFSAIKPEYNKKYDENFIDNEIDNFLDNKTIVNDLFNNYQTVHISDFSKDYIRSKSKEDRRKYILGALGCKLSHLEILKHNTDKNILLLEDDAIFHSNFIFNYNILLDNLKKNEFDMVWLNGNWLYKLEKDLYHRCNNYKSINEHFGKIDDGKYIDNINGSSLNTAGLVFHKNCIHSFLKNYEKSKKREIDMMYRECIQSKGKCFTTIPNLIIQGTFESSIESFTVHYIRDIHYKTRQKYNIFTVLRNKEEANLFFHNLKNNLKKMIGYEKIYYISYEKYFDYNILSFIDLNFLETDIEQLKINFPNKIHDNSIRYFLYHPFNMYVNDNFIFFDENNNLLQTKNIFQKK